MNTQEIMNMLWLIFEIIGTVAFAISGALLAVEKENDIFEIYNHIDKSKVMVTNLIGNNGIINKKEFKNISKKLDKNKKTE